MRFVRPSESLLTASRDHEITVLMNAIDNDAVNGIVADCAKVGFPVSRETAEKAWEVHKAEGKQAASDVLTAAGVPMERRIVSGAAGLGGKAQTVAWGVGKVHIFVGW